MAKKIELTHCNLCDSFRYSLVYREPKQTPPRESAASYVISEAHLEKPKKIVKCMSCGLVYALPEMPLADIRKTYTEMIDLDYIQEEKGRRQQAGIILEQISKYKKRGRLLDVGCGPGFFLDEAKRLGWEVTGVDLSGWAKDYCKEHFGIDVLQGVLTELGLPNRSFDVIVLNDVIEHLADPKATLKEIRQILKNDGVIYVSTPDIDSALSQLLGARWWGINKYHLFYFSKKTLEQFFREVGFKAVRYSAYPRVFSMNYWAKRLKSYPAFIAKPVEFLSGFGGWGERSLKIFLHDQIGVIAKKIIRLDSVGAEEGVPKEPTQKKLKVTAALPAYNAEKTLERTVADIPRNSVDEIILVDDHSRDGTVALAKKIGLVVFEHPTNQGYGANQKTCYEMAIERGADIVVMVHPDYQYDPRIIPQLVEPIHKGAADAVFGSRMMKGGALEGGMPIWKHNANVVLTAFENVMLGAYLTEYHSGFRAYSARLLKGIDFKANSNGFLFDTEIIVQALANHYKIEEIPIRTRYFEEASSIKLWPSILYGLGIVRIMFIYFLHARGLMKVKRFEMVR